ncbi:MAG: hypothetical protein M3250_02040 [Thermoproteota archaeon]|nr:hypothetical protein [Thermoproteota archaeon]
MVAKHFSISLRNITSSNSNKTNSNNRRGFNEEGTTANLPATLLSLFQLRCYGMPDNNN